MSDICQAFLLCVLPVESSDFKLFMDVCRTAILALRELSKENEMLFVKIQEIKVDKKLQIIPDLLLKIIFYDILCVNKLPRRKIYV